MNDLLKVARECFPNYSDEELAQSLWNITCFPFGTNEQVIENLREASKENNQNLDQAFAWAEAKTNKAMKEFNQIEKYAEILGIPYEVLSGPELWSASKLVMNASSLGKPGYSIIKTTELEQLRDNSKLLHGLLEAKK